MSSQNFYKTLFLHSPIACKPSHTAFKRSFAISGGTAFPRSSCRLVALIALGKRNALGNPCRLAMSFMVSSRMEPFCKVIFLNAYGRSPPPLCAQIVFDLGFTALIPALSNRKGNELRFLRIGNEKPKLCCDTTMYSRLRFCSRPYSLVSST